MPTVIELPSSDEPSNKEDAMAERARIIKERNELQLKASSQSVFFHCPLETFMLFFF
jgi:hypothetical protein